MQKLKYRWSNELGFQYFDEKGRSIVAKAQTTAKKELDNKVYFKALEKLLINISKHPYKPEYKPELEITVGDKNDNNTFYKFIEPYVFEKYISKGIFQFGNILYYQSLERQQSRDPFEGFTHLIIERENDRKIVTAVSGLNYHIFCGTYKIPENVKMINRFGNYLLKIPNLNSFADAASKALGAKKVLIDKVTYHEHKVHDTSEHIDHKDNVIMSPDLFDFIYNNLNQTSIFQKGKYFSDEYELRIAFEMPKYLKSKPITISNKGLLDYIEIIKL